MGLLLYRDILVGVGRLHEAGKNRQKPSRKSDPHL